MKVEPKEWKSVITQWMKEAGIKEKKAFPLMVFIHKSRKRVYGKFIIWAVHLWVPPNVNMKDLQWIFYHEFYHYCQSLNTVASLKETPANKFAIEKMNGYIPCQYREWVLRMEKMEENLYP